MVSWLPWGGNLGLFDQTFFDYGPKTGGFPVLPAGRVNEHNPSLVAKSAREGGRRLAFPRGDPLSAGPRRFLEAALALLGGRTGGRTTPWWGSAAASPLFELEEDGATYCTARSRQLFFGRQQLKREKPERTFRIFGLGGSTVRGRPYETDSAFLKWLEIELDGRDARGNTKRSTAAACRMPATG